MTNRLKNGNLLLIQLLNKSILDEAKFFEDLLINMHEFDRIENTSKETPQLEIFLSLFLNSSFVFKIIDL